MNLHRLLCRWGYHWWQHRAVARMDFDRTYDHHDWCRCCNLTRLSR